MGAALRAVLRGLFAGVVAVWGAGGVWLVERAVIWGMLAEGLVLRGACDMAGSSLYLVRLAGLGGLPGLSRREKQRRPLRMHRVGGLDHEMGGWGVVN